MGWYIEGEAQAPQRIAAVYFIYLPVTGKCLFANELNNYSAPMTNFGDVSTLEHIYPNCPLIPIDPHLALSLNWITVDEMTMEMPYVTDSLKACLKLIKDVKEEEHGKDSND